MRDHHLPKDAEALAVYDRMVEVFFYFKPNEDLNETVRSDFIGYGTAAHEFFRNRKELSGMARMQADQLRNQEFTLKRMPVLSKLLDDQKTCLIIEEFELHMLANNHKLPLRLSTILEKKDGKWQVAHFHGSTPDSDIAEEEAFPMEGLRRKNEELEAKIKERTRDLEIEAALERVRASTMAMHSSEDLSMVASVLFDEMRHLGGDLFAFGIVLCDKYEDKVEQWHSMGEGSMMSPFLVPIDLDYIHQYRYDQWKAGEELFSIEIPEDYIAKHFELMFEIPSVKTAMDEVEAAGIDVAIPKWEIDYGASFSHGYLLVSSLKPFKEDYIFPRFARVFEQAYTRFLDLQKAEAQAREAQVEASLERVRARTMAMQHSDELAEASHLLDKEVRDLGIKTWGCAFNIYREKDAIEWFGNEQGLLPTYTVPREGIFKEYYNMGQQGETLYVKEFSGEECVAHYEYMSTLPVVGDVLRQLKKTNGSFPTYQIDHVVFFKYGYLLFITRESVPESYDIFRRFAKVFEQTYTRFLDLQKAEAQAREAQVEAALERVRSRSMAMHKTDELQDVINTVYRQFLELKVEITGGAFIAINSEIESELVCWGAGGTADYIQKVHLPLMDMPIYTEIVAGIKNGPGFFEESFTLEEKQQFFDELFKIPPYSEATKAHKKEVLSRPGGYTRSCVVSEHTSVFIINHHGRPFTEEENDILKRIGKVFEQTYMRFLDLQKAEVQAREAEIELALERVRAKTMAMQNSEELKEVIQVIFDQLSGLHINAEHAGIVVDYEPGQDWNFWIAETQDIPSRISVPYLDLPWDRQFAEAKEMGNDFFTTLLNFEEKNSFYRELLAHIPDMTKEARDFYFECDGLAISTTIQKDIALYIENFSGTPYSVEENEILKRFGKVFQQTYTRFLDLKKAEAQAREARIEAALEKIRSRTMAMQHSNELPEAANLLFLEIQALGIPAWSCGYNILAEDNKSATCWMSSEGAIQEPFILRLWGENSFEEMGTFVRSKDTFLVQELGGKAIEAHYDHMKSFPDLLPIFEHLQAQGLSLPTYQINHLCKFSQGFLLFITYEKVPEAHELFKRFSSVFEQTYTRFLDLKRAEAQARESKIETALERVRARALAMQQPEEIKEVAQVMRREMGLLGVEELETSSIYIHDQETNTTECWYAIKDIREEEKVMVADYFVLDLNETQVGREMLKFYESSEEQVSIVMKGEARKEWINYCETHSKVLQGYYGEVIPERTYHLYKFSHGAIGVATPASLSEESWGLLKRAASVFSLAYSRFKDLTQARMDLQLLKEEKKRAEDALKELQLTQQQLVHAEKMASLGELTAGIAHEIQNPLNFVNNFSEVSQELLEEMIEELNNGDEEEVDAIAKDVIQNLEKINHHGKRADSIVKGMLQHSRSGDGKKEATDLNALADEYLRLAYHGLRAKDKSFNASMDMDFDEDVGKVMVNPQDIGRVLLNLLTNAFHAVSEKKVQVQEGYQPIVTVKTGKAGKGVEIQVIDNGNGIPEKIRDKIFQPFFTTKPTGQGTGLGLSMSYDIVTKGHGGKMKVKSEKGKGTTFTVTLPGT